MWNSILCIQDLEVLLLRKTLRLKKIMWQIWCVNEFSVHNNLKVLIRQFNTSPFMNIVYGKY